MRMNPDVCLTPRSPRVREVTVGRQPKTRSSRASKYDFVKVRVWLSTHYYILSRFIVSRVLTVTKIPYVDSIGIALDLKKRLVDKNCLDVQQEEMELELFAVMRSNGYGSDFIKRYKMMMAFHHSRTPLLVLIGGSAKVGKSTVATRLAERLNMPNVFHTDITYNLIKNFVEELDPLPLWQRNFAKDEDLVQAFCHESRLVRRGVDADVQKCFKEGKALFAEGLHVEPSAYMDLLADQTGDCKSDMVTGFPIVVMFLLETNETDHSIFLSTSPLSWEVAPLPSPVTHHRGKSPTSYSTPTRTRKKDPPAAHLLPSLPATDPLTPEARQDPSPNTVSQDCDADVSTLRICSDIEARSGDGNGNRSGDGGGRGKRGVAGETSLHSEQKSLDAPDRPRKLILEGESANSGTSHLQILRKPSDQQMRGLQRSQPVSQQGLEGGIQQQPREKAFGKEHSGPKLEANDMRPSQLQRSGQDPSVWQQSGEPSTQHLRRQPGSGKVSPGQDQDWDPSDQQAGGAETSPRPPGLQPSGPGDAEVLRRVRVLQNYLTGFRGKHGVEVVRVDALSLSDAVDKMHSTILDRIEAAYDRSAASFDGTSM
eukprot:Rmarinus@m.7611